MSNVVILSICLVGIGAVFLLASLLSARKTWQRVPAELRGRWRITVYLMGFFLIGYLFFDIILVSDLPFPVELVTGSVFFGGAIFVFIIINLAHDTITKIRTIETEFKGLFENANDLIHSVSTDGKFLYTNRAWRDILGYSLHEIESMSAFDIIPAEYQPHCKQVFADVMKGCDIRTETVFVAKSGKRIHLEGIINCRYKEGHVFAIRGIYRDMTEHKRVQKQLKTLNESLEQRVSERTMEVKNAYDLLLGSRQTLQTILDAMPYGVIIIGRDKKIRSANAAALALANYHSEEEITGQICNTTLCPAQEGKCPIIDLKEELDRSERLLITKDGRHIPIMKTVVPLTIEGEDVLLEAVIDITERKQAEDQIRLLAYYDSLTSLPNRALFTELLTRALNFARRHDKLMAVLFIDLDAFKRINDTLGHTIGDELLQAVAERLLRSVRNSDHVCRANTDDAVNIVSRLGGDEFIVTLPYIDQSHEAGIVAQRILQDLAKPMMLKGHEVIVSASIGISLYPNDGKNVETLCKNADLAMYQAKTMGKNNFQFYDKSMSTTAFDRLHLENELHKALERGEFQLYYQPKVSIKNGDIVGLEALIRWTHPQRGVCSPAHFIPLAEETGLIMPIGEWVLRTACHQGKLWQAEGLKPLPISVNISKRQFEQDQFAETVLRILKETDFPPHLLELEITESMIMQDPEAVIAMLNKLKSNGVMISIDDFGTGYSSLGELRRLPLDALKIDRSFITNIVSNGDDAVIARAIIAMSHSLKLKVIAEGVETEAQLEFLHGLSCDQAQGYLFSRPVPAREFPHLAVKAKRFT